MRGRPARPGEGVADGPSAVGPLYVSDGGAGVAPGGRVS